MNESTSLGLSAATADDAAASTAAEVVRAEGLVKEFRGGDGGIIRRARRVSLTVKRGEMVAIMGYSGAGKSTLLHLLGALERPSAGTDRVGRSTIAALADDALAALRNRTVGFVFQFHHLLREFSALENVMMPLRIAGDDRGALAAEELLAASGLACDIIAAGTIGRRAAAHGGRASVGGRSGYRVGGRAYGKPRPSKRRALEELFAQLARDLEIGMVVVTHNRSLAARADRALLLEDGRLVPIRMFGGSLPDVV